MTVPKHSVFKPSIRKPTKSPSPVPPKQEEYAADFEEYDDDFETMSEHDERKVQSVQKALKRENEKIVEKPKQTQVQQTPTITPGPRKVVMDIESAQKDQAKKKKVLKSQQRAKDLQGLVDLDFTIVDLFDFPPMNSYTLYMRGFGGSGISETGVQTSEEMIAKEVQTEDWNIMNRWTEAPPNQFQESGLDPPSLPWLAPKKEKKQEEPVLDARLGDFLRKASQVVEILLEEAAHEDTDEIEDIDTQGFLSPRSLELSKPSILSEYTISFLEATDNDLRILVVCWSQKQASGSLASLLGPEKLNMYKSVIGLFHVGDSEPFALLAAIPKITCAVLLTHKQRLLVACGTTDGSIQLFNARTEDQSLKITVEERQLLLPTYSTDCLLSEAGGHDAPIVKIQSRKREDKDHPYLLVCDQSANIRTWFLGQDYQLIPGEFWKIKTQDPLLGDVIVNDIEMHPKRCLVAPDVGSIIHRSGNFGPNVPRTFKLLQNKNVLPLASFSTCISLNPFLPQLFVAGFSCGTLGLFSTSLVEPVHKWHLNSEIVQLSWSPTRPCVFYCMDGSQTMSVFDISVDIQEPQMTLECNKICATPIMDRRANVLLVSLDDRVHVHFLSQLYSEVGLDEERGLEAFVFSQ